MLFNGTKSDKAVFFSFLLGGKGVVYWFRIRGRYVRVGLGGSFRVRSRAKGRFWLGPST